MSEKEEPGEGRQKELASFGKPRISLSLEVGLLILQRFSLAQPWMGIADIADELKLSRSTTHRYVITLQVLGYLEQGAKRKYRLAQGAAYFSASMLNATGLQ